MFDVGSINTSLAQTIIDAKMNTDPDNTYLIPQYPNRLHKSQGSRVDTAFPILDLVMLNIFDYFRLP
jgi:hypothetical protein